MGHAISKLKCVNRSKDLFMFLRTWHAALTLNPKPLTLNPKSFYVHPLTQEDPGGTSSTQKALPGTKGIWGLQVRN